MSTEPTITRVQRITENPPVFPCWLYEPRDFLPWIRYIEPAHDFGLKTHWHPDQPTTPTERPDAPSTPSPTPEGNIATHFEMLMSVEEQQRIGVTADRAEHMRVMRVLARYADMQCELAAAKAERDAAHAQIEAWKNTPVFAIAEQDAILRAELAEAKRDTERLEWLFAKNPEVWIPFIPAINAARKNGGAK